LLGRPLLAGRGLEPRLQPGVRLAGGPGFGDAMRAIWREGPCASFASQAAHEPDRGAHGGVLAHPLDLVEHDLLVLPGKPGEMPAGPFPIRGSEQCRPGQLAKRDGASASGFMSCFNSTPTPWCRKRLALARARVGWLACHFF
jgi:hypothetical protein